MKLLRLIPDDTKIPFMRYSRFGFFISGILCVLSVVAFFTIGLNMGVDFKGGTVLVVRELPVAKIDQMRTAISGLGLGDSTLQQFGPATDVQIRMESQDSPEADQAAVARMVTALGPQVQILAQGTVGASVSGDLTEGAIEAVFLAIVLVLIYMWIRFEWQFAVGAVISLFHDVLLSIGLFCVLEIDFNLSIIAAILTIIGYSLNDTVVVFDRVREFLRKYKQMPLANLIDFSINSVLPRTLLTSCTTLLALIALYVFGGEVIRGFTFAMIWGVLIGTYSSIFVAAPVLILLGVKRDWSGAGTKERKTAAAARP